MYEVKNDPYCYPGTTVLKNRLGLRKRADLEAFEAEITAQRAAEPLPAGRLSYAHYRAIHHHLFQDVYAWAGRIRVLRIFKGDPRKILNAIIKSFGGNEAPLLAVLRRLVN